MLLYDLVIWVEEQKGSFVSSIVQRSHAEQGLTSNAV